MLALKNKPAHEIADNSDVAANTKNQRTIETLELRGRRVAKVTFEDVDAIPTPDMTRHGLHYCQWLVERPELDFRNRGNNPRKAKSGVYHYGCRFAVGDHNEEASGDESEASMHVKRPIAKRDRVLASPSDASAEESVVMVCKYARKRRR